jgi:hypothetical protein
MANHKWTEEDVKNILTPIVHTADWAADCPDFEMMVVAMTLSLIRHAKRPTDDPIFLRMQPWLERLHDNVTIIKRVLRGEIDIEFAENAAEPVEKSLT